MKTSHYVTNVTIIRHTPGWCWAGTRARATRSGGSSGGWAAMRASAGWAPAAPCPSPSPPAPQRHSPASQVPLLGTISPGGHYTSLITGIRIIITNCPCLHSVLCHNVMMDNITTT